MVGAKRCLTGFKGPQLSALHGTVERIDIGVQDCLVQVNLALHGIVELIDIGVQG